MNCADAALCRLETQKPYLIRASDLLAESSFATDIICNWNGTRYSAFTSDNGLSTPQNHASLLRRAANNHAQYMYVRFSDVIKFRVAMRTISEKAIRLRHPDYDPDRAQKLISSAISRHLSTRNISSKSIHAFLTNLANRQTDKRTRAKHLPPPLLEVFFLSLFLSFLFGVTHAPFACRR